MTPRTQIRRRAPVGWSAVLAALLLLTGPQAARAGDGGEADEELEGGEDDGLSLDDEFALLADELVVEGAARHRQELGQSPSSITVITREDIATSGATTIPDLMRLVPGMDVVVVTPFNLGVTSRSAWTYENNVYLVLIDGREINDELLGQTAYQAQPVSVEDIERIEVIRGALGALYGANAFAGVVSITTRGIGAKPRVEARIRAGEFGTMGASALGSGRIGDFGLLVSAGGEFARSFADRDLEAFRSWKVRALGEYRFSEDTRLQLDVSADGAQGKFSTGAGNILGNYKAQFLRLVFQSPDVRAHLYYAHTPTSGELDQPLSLLGVTLAEFAPVASEMNAVDAQVQWTLPSFYEPLSLILGAAARVNQASSDQFLVPDTFLDPTSDRYHQAGGEFWDWRAGGFLQAEYAPAEWVTLTAGARYDYNSVVGGALSPRLAAVFEPADGHFLRLGAGRSHRKPAFLETRLHLDLTFPEDSPLAEPERQAMRELMTRVLGNEDLGYEKLTTAELGYLAVLLDGKLRLTVDLYYGFYEDMSELSSRVDFGDLEHSSFRFENIGADLDIFGSELSLRYLPVEGVSLLAGWCYREIWYREAGLSHGERFEAGQSQGKSPRNLFTLGGRFHTTYGLLGSLYAFFRSEFRDEAVDNPAGLLAPYLVRQNPSSVMLLGRLGYRLRAWDAVDLETGLRIFLPISFEAPYWVVYERAGGVTPEGRGYGGEPLGRVLSVYLEGAY
ncbi:MAG TPA: TonB-dependent receptor [Myxococcota bacterium]|nr:TonB-dependent receptor [Myxococcota bacterium]HRY95721.1 TonB-dependent receptor [Myxococcota bacterium]HSA21028.1 TonB-dependent receptor [Myxococcota bacterium]